tara:strand:+ start:253 stop:1059 length:807 start_codon:yes stop_codon:yes gene_type:complete
MKKLILILIIVTGLVGCQSKVVSKITIKCQEDVKVGSVIEVDGESYKVVDEEMLKEMIANNDDITFVCTSKITDLSRLFSHSDFNQPIGNWDVSNVTNMSGMFSYSAFDQDISSWDVSNVTDMHYMFAYTVFNQPIGNWDVSNVTNMSGMFYESKFNQPIGDWDVSNVTDINDMFGYSKFDGDISKWVNKPILPSVRNNSENVRNNSENDCTSIDENRINTIMKQLNNDVISIQNVGNRKYFVQYINWNSGEGRDGTEVYDYSNKPCN